MRYFKFRHINKLPTLITTVIIVALSICIVIFPRPVFQAAVKGLQTWWNIVVPALFPFFVVSQIFIGLGIVNFLGVLLEPIMRPLFNVPGDSAFVVAMGYTSGAPISAMLTAQLRRQRALTQVEAERLICFTNNASPLFMLGAVSVGMLQNQTLGPIIAAAHYSANLCLGLLFRFYGCQQRRPSMEHYSLLVLPQRAWQSMLQVQLKNSRPLGQIIAEAVQHSFQTLFTIGGFIVLFNVILQITTFTGFLQPLARAFVYVCKPLNLEPWAAHVLVTGSLEMTMGAKLASEIGLPLQDQLISISLILGWGGLSIWGQVAAMISKTDIRLAPFMVARLLHGFLAAILVHFFYGPAKPVLLLLSRHTTFIGGFPQVNLWLSYTDFPAILIFTFLFLVGLGLAARYCLFRRL